MNRMRVYLPITPEQLGEAVRAGAVAPRVGFAPTHGLAAAAGIEDEEELEYLAYDAAAAAGVVVLAASGADGGEARLCRVVVSADVASADLAEVPGDDPVGSVLPEAAVRIVAPLAWADVVSVHVDEDEAGPVLAAALAGGDVDAVTELELLWHHPDEVPGLLADWGLGAR